MGVRDLPQTASVMWRKSLKPVAVGSDITPMNSHLRALKRLIDDGMYVVDERAVAEAIVARANVNASVANVSFRSEVTPPVLRSFRRDAHARSFRLERNARLHG